MITVRFIAALTNKHNRTSHYQSKFSLFELELINLQAMDRACGTYGVNINACWILVGKYVGKRPRGRSRLRWEVTVEVDLKEMIPKSFLLFVRRSDTIIMFQGNI